MVNINELSNIGYGGYRIRNDSKENEKALHYALEKGCNRIRASIIHSLFFLLFNNMQFLMRLV